ncbi:MAG TPA: DNA polymerase I [Acholeplasmataceae bacterium]|nr:DNA polymerase I [Acholeplasmataceae bacterium]
MTVLLIDGNSILFRAYYATAGIPGRSIMQTKSGLYTNALYGFVGMLIKSISNIKPTHILVAFDTKAKTFRHEEFDDYKAQRKPMPEELAMQIPAIKDFLDVMGIKRLEIEGFEGDDIIGTFAKKAKRNNHDVIILSGDKDMLQLVDDHVQVFLTRHGVSDLEVFNIDNFYDKMQISPKQIVDFKALTGDNSDNLPGIRGVGPKTAYQLLSQFETIENMFSNVDQVKGKIQQNIIEDKEIAIRTKRLATINCDVALEEDIPALKRQTFYKLELRQFFERYEFNHMIGKIDAIPNVEETFIQEESVVNSPKIEVDYSFEEACKCFKQPSFIEVELDHANYHRANVLGISLLFEEKGFFLEKERLFDEKVMQYLEDSSIKKGTLDSKRLIASLAKLGIDVQGIDFDVTLGVYCVNPSHVSNSLPTMFSRMIPCDLPEIDAIYGKKAKYHVPDLTVYAQYSLDKCFYAKRIKQPLIEALTSTDQLSLLTEMEIPLAKVLAEMETNGFAIDKKRLVAIGETFKQEIERLREEIFAKSGTEFNIDSPKQLGQVLFEKLGLSTGRKNKTGYSTAADVLKSLAEKHDVPRLVLEYRKYVKLYNTYVTGLIEEIHPDGKVHTIFKQALTLTGRLSSTEPNIQNIPVKTEDGRLIRSAFVPSLDVLLSADYSQIELRILASMAKSAHMIDDFNHGLDLHASTASKIHDVPLEEVTKDMRRYAKAVNFGIIYGMSDWGLSETLHISPGEAARFIDKYFAIYPEIKVFLEKIVEEAKQKGYTTTLFNRRRYIPELSSPNFALRKFGERTALNAPIQGTAADIIKKAMVLLNQALKEANLKSKLIAQVHDELVLDVKQEELETVKKIVKEKMEKATEIGVKLTVDVKSGSNWNM